jgi:hypothetical protein
MTTSLRYLCCSGWSCGCGGELLDLDVCSDTCHENKRDADARDYADFDRQRAIDQGYGAGVYFREPFE